MSYEKKIQQDNSITWIIDDYLFVIEPIFDGKKYQFSGKIIRIEDCECLFSVFEDNAETAELKMMVEFVNYT